MKYVVTLNGKNYEVEVEEGNAVLLNVSDTAAAPAPVAMAAAAAPTAAAPVASAEGEKVLSPMPGSILAVKVSVGQSVKAGDVLFILEAMKMENEIAAPKDGVIKQLLVGKGTAVATDDVLAVL